MNANGGKPPTCPSDRSKARGANSNTHRTASSRSPSSDRPIEPQTTNVGHRLPLREQGRTPMAAIRSRATTLKTTTAMEPITTTTARSITTTESSISSRRGLTRDCTLSVRREAGTRATTKGTIELRRQTNLTTSVDPRSLRSNLRGNRRTEATSR